MPFCAPQIVYSNLWLNQSAAIAATDILSPVAGGIYRVSIALTCVSDAYNKDIVGSVTTSYDTSPDVAVNTGGQPVSAADCVFPATTTEHFKFQVSVSGTDPSYSYNAYVVIEQIQ